jgi:hypothetical protein
MLKLICTHPISRQHNEFILLCDAVVGNIGHRNYAIILRQKSPNDLDMANPGELNVGSQTRATFGSSGRENILPLRCLIRCASPVNDSFSLI